MKEEMYDCYEEKYEGMCSFMLKKYGISNLQYELIKLRNEYSNKDYNLLLTEEEIEMEYAVDIINYKAKWQLLHLHVSESNCKIKYIPII